MFGDSFRSVESEELDAQWDRLVRGDQPRRDGPLLPIVSELSARIPAGSADAKARVRQALRLEAVPGLVTTSSAARILKLQEMPAQSFRNVPSKRWLSSPMAVIEAIAACLVIAALALGISVYQSRDDSGSFGDYAISANSSPEPLPPLDFAEVSRMQAAAQPSSTSVDGTLGIGTSAMNLSEVYFPVDTGYVAPFTGVNLVSVVHGTVTITVDEGVPIMLSSGESTSAFVEDRFSIRNTGTDMAYIVHGMVYQQPVDLTPAADEPPVLDYYPNFLGNAVIDLSNPSATVSLKIFDETTINQAVHSDATTLFLNRTDPVTLVVTDGLVGIRSSTTSSDDYQTGGGFAPIAIGSSTILGSGSNNVLIQPGASYELSAPIESDVLAVSLQVAVDGE